MSGTLQATVIKDGASSTNNITLDGSGNVTAGANLYTTSNLGVATSSPATKLDVNGPASVTSFTGTTKLGAIIRGSTGATDYSGVDFTGNSQTAPTGRIAVITTGGGSSMSFGTSNSYASGITNTAMTIDSAGVITGSAGNLMLVQGTAVASTSGTSITFTGIPSWAKRITIMLNGVSTSGSSNYQMQVGSGSVTTTGYAGICASAGGANQTAYANFSSGFVLTANTAAAYTYQGIVTLSLLGSNIWCESGNLGAVGLNFLQSSGGSVTLAGALDRVVLTTVNGTDTFDAGSINIQYE